MRRIITTFLTLFVIVGLFSFSACTAKKEEVPPIEEEVETIKRPFPQHVKYAVNPMMPTNKTQDELDEMIIGLFREILRNDLIVDTKAPQNKEEFRMVFRHYLAWEIEENEIEVSHLNVSESQGYGMLILVLMAGCEGKLEFKEEDWIFGCSSLQEYYNAMLRTVLAFPSIVGENNHLFCWELTGYDRDGDNRTGYKIVDGVKTAPFTQNPKDGDSATDGDMDIIYSLLLADKQWGSTGTYNYKQIAQDMLESLWEYCVHKDYYTLLLGDWASNTDDKVLANATRTSDFILSHLKVFAVVDKSHDWQKVIDATYNVIMDIRESENAKGHKNGLLPDFVVRGKTKWEVPKGEVLEGDEDNAYAYNACRIPWRLGTDYLLFGDTKIGEKSLAEYIIKPLDEFAKKYTKGKMEVLGPLHLNGKPFDWDDAESFASPFLITAVANGADQDWVNKIWAYEGLTEYYANNYGDYFDLIVMITASGNYWLPIE